MRINHNISALNAWRQLGQNDNNLGKSLERLSSGLRINRAADDAAGLAISEKMRAQISGLNQAVRNAQDSISLIQTAEGALNETHSILQRMRELAVQSSNDTLTSADREEIQKEITQLADEMNRIGNTTEFNTKKLLNGSLDFAAATAAEVGGIAVSGPITIDDAKTSGYAQAGTQITDTGYTGSTPKDRPWVTTGNVNVGAAPSVTAADNELTFTYGGTQYDIQMSVAAHADQAALVADVQTQIDGAIGANEVAVSVNAGGNLVFTAVNAGSDPDNQFQVDGGNFAATWIGTASYTEGIDSGDVWIHGETDGYTTGNVSITDTGLAGSNITIDAANNELTLRVYNADTDTWTEGNITLADDVYDGDSVAGATREDLRADIEAKVQAIGGDFAAATVEFDVDNTLKINAVGLGEGSQIHVTGGNAMDELFGATTDHTDYTGEAANNELTFDLDGTGQSITLSSGYYDDADDVVAEINTQLTAGAIAATASNESGFIRITSDATGVDSDINNVAGSAAAEIGMATSTEVSGADGNRTLSIEVDGESVDATIQEGTYNDLNVLAAAVESAINSATSTAADVSVSWDADNNTFSITSGSTGTSSTITVNTHANDDAAGSLGLTGLNGSGTDEENEFLTFHIGSNKGQSMDVSVNDVRSAALGITNTDSSVTSVDGNDVTYAAAESVDNEGSTEYVLSVLTKESANDAIAVLDNAISTVSSERSKLGAVQNRLEHTIANLGVAAENLTAAESRIRDVDMAQEMMAFTRNQILSQAGTAMLAQANMKPQSVLQLLG